MSDRVIEGIDSAGNEVKFYITDDRYLPVVLTALDTETTSTQISVACDASGRLYAVLEFDGDLTVTTGDLEKLLSGSYWLDTRIDDTSGNVDYKGVNTVHKATEATATWRIWKFSDYSGGIARRKEGPLVGSWTGRAALAWDT
jgi:hypothetical protein